MNYKVKMGQNFSNNCTGNIDDIYEPKYVEVQSKTNSIRRNSSQNNLVEAQYSNQPFSRKPSFVRFVETTNKELRICNICEKIDNSLVQYNQCIECGSFHCGFHRNRYHKDIVNISRKYSG